MRHSAASRTARLIATPSSNSATGSDLDAEMVPANVITLAMSGNEPNSAPRQKLRRHRWFSAFFAFGATMCALTIALLLFQAGHWTFFGGSIPVRTPRFKSIGSC
jgi:hypothetical protein